jgi:hypothetical protein
METRKAETQRRDQGTLLSRDIRTGHQHNCEDLDIVIHLNSSLFYYVMTCMLSFQEEQEAAFKQGLLPVARYDDVLGKSLPNPEHPGRVRGVGGLVPMTKTYGKSSTRKPRTLSRSEEEFDARVDQRVEERVRGLKDILREEIRQEMKSELAILVREAMGQKEPVFSPTVVQSSCQSVKQLPGLSGFTEVMQIQLYFPLHVLFHTYYFIRVKTFILYRRQK